MSRIRLPGWMRAGRKSGSNYLGRRGVFIRNFIILVLIWFITFHSVYLDTNGWYFCGPIIENDNALIRGPTNELVAAIRKTTKLAAGGTLPAALTEEERMQWDFANPCQSRLGLKSIYARRKYTMDIDDNLNWDMVLQEYARLHRTCTQRVGSLKQYFVARNSSIAGCKFTIADYSDGGGLGNKIVAITNAVLYSILTQRIVLVPSVTLVPSLICEPFPGSSWVLDASDSFPLPPWDPVHIGSWTYHDEVYDELDNAKMRLRKNARTPPSNIYSSSMGVLQYQPESRFFCDTEQDSFAGVTWLYFTGCLYIIPRFFSVPSLRPTLESLFPDRRVLTHLVRSIMLPEDLVWAKIVQSFKAHFEKADRLVGVQIRYRRNMDEYQRMNDIINDRIMKCAIDNGILPAAIRANSSNAELRGDRVKLFIASLFTGFQEMLSETYLPHPKSIGAVVSLVQLSHENEQTYGLEVDRQSLLEIFMLSFSEDLLLTPLSTFGGLAQAYGNLVPWIIDYRYGHHFGACERGQTVDLCYQEAEFKYSCPHDLEVNGKVISDLVPYIRNCLDVDSQLRIAPGFQLITTSPPKPGQQPAA